MAGEYNTWERLKNKMDASAAPLDDPYNHTTSVGGNDIYYDANGRKRLMPNPLEQMFGTEGPRVVPGSGNSGLSASYLNKK